MAAYAEIADRYRQAIKKGELVRGDRFPIQPEIAEEHGVSIATVHRIMGVLKQEGLVYTTHSGTYVGPRPERPEEPEGPQVARCHSHSCRNTLELPKRMSIFDVLRLTGWIYRGTQLGRVYYCHVCAPGVKARDEESRYRGKG